MIYLQQRNYRQSVRILIFLWTGISAHLLKGKN
ncbi:hypothetical protein BN440_3011 [Erwinia amylovora MR1]|nr:hypothetical protein BN440_3011 [Erwinia amylovora MR1]